jgi:hypothetical protein
MGKVKTEVMKFSGGEQTIQITVDGQQLNQTTGF